MPKTADMIILKVNKTTLTLNINSEGWRIYEKQKRHKKRKADAGTKIIGNKKTASAFNYDDSRSGFGVYVFIYADFRNHSRI